MIDTAQARTAHGERQIERAIDHCAHPAKRRHGPVHWTGREGRVPGERRFYSGHSRHRAHQQPGSGSAIAAIERCRRCRPAAAAHDPFSARTLRHRCPECIQRRLRRHHVGAFQQAVDASLSLGHGAEDQRAMGAALVAWNRCHAV